MKPPHVVTPDFPGRQVGSIRKNLWDGLPEKLPQRVWITH